ncbi:hypothetical protein RSJ42_05930 [Methanosarcina hadiensis]|uniref:tyrosine-type recombinase/integrase n=1 Tax=Methanosarcina hadiensis TaxID=3078083 RepID=UPI00397750A3
MKSDELKNELNVKKWFKNIKAKDRTKISYLFSMQQYTEFTGMTPEELLSQAEEEMGLPIRRRQLKDHILDFRDDLIQQGLSDFTVKGRIAAVKSFYTSFDIAPPKIRGDSRPVTKKENDQIPTKEDLQDCIAVCDPLEKAIMLAGISSGLAATEVRNLKLSEFKKGYDPETEITTLSLRREKTGVDFITFFSPEASRAIWDYLEYRNRQIKTTNKLRQSQLEKQRTTENSYLFILHKVSYDYLETHDEELRKISEYAMLKIYKEISNKARKNSKSGSYNFIRSHTMRKYFNSTLLNAGCDSFHTEFWMGHALDDTQAAYFRANIQQQKELYLKFVPHLIIQKELNVAESPEYIRIKNENEVLARESIKHVVERQEILKINTEFENYKIQSEIRIIEMEMISKIQPYQFQIEKDQEALETCKLCLKLPNDEKTDSHAVYKAQIQCYEDDIIKLKAKIEEIKIEYQMKIDKWKCYLSEK